MTGLDALLAFCFTCLALGAARRRRQPWYAMLAGLTTLGIVFAVLTGRLALGRWTPDPLDLAVVLGGLFFAAEFFGLPTPVARRLGIGLRSRQWEFDVAMYDIVKGFADLLSAYPGPELVADDQAWRRRALCEGHRLVARLNRLHPPDEGWAQLRDGYRVLYQAILADLASADHARRSEEFGIRAKEIEKRHAELRQRYRAEAAAILHDRDRS